MKRVSVLYNPLIRRVFRVSVGATAIAVLGLLIAVPPANASGVALICEGHGFYCIAAPTLHLDDPVVEELSGRYIVVTPLGGISYTLAFQASPSLCVSADNDNDTVVQHPCNGGAGVVWLAHLGPDGVSCIFESQEFPGRYLSGHNDGTQFRLKNEGAFGWYQQFDTSSHVISFCGGMT